MYPFQKARILVVEDHEGFIILLKFLLSEIGIQHLHVAKNYEDALEKFSDHAPDICILDIDLGAGEKSGIDIAEKIREDAPETPIIFLTSNYSEEYYRKCRHVRPLGFMNKELSRFKIQHVLDLALLQYEYVAENKSAATPVFKAPFLTEQKFFFKIGDYFKALPIKEIDYFYADQKMTYAKSASRSYPTSVQLKVIEDEFINDFARIHKKYLVNISQIESILPKENAVIINRETLPIGYAYRKSFFIRLNLLK